MLNERISMQKVWTPLKKCFRASRMTCCSESLSPEKPMWRLSPAHLRRSAGKKAEQLRVIPEKKPKADKESARSGTKRQQEVYATIDKSYEDMKDSKRVTEDSALVSLRYTARNMVETCDVLFTNFPGLLEKPDYKDQVIEIMQEPKQYILKLEGETDNEQH